MKTQTCAESKEGDSFVASVAVNQEESSSQHRCTDLGDVWKYPADPQRPAATSR